jgi:two-component system CheB/CheR fusion protein
MGEEKRNRVLVVEDRKDAADSLATLLQLEGFDVRICYDGSSALHELEQWRPTAAIIDIGLPGVSGYAVAQHVRELPFGSGVLLIALTAYAYPSDIEQARYAGFNWHVSKPASPTVVVDILRDPRRAAQRRDAVRLIPPASLYAFCSYRAACDCARSVQRSL